MHMYVYILILILILASPYFDGVHRGLNQPCPCTCGLYIVHVHVPYDGSGNAIMYTRFRTVLHAPNGFSLPVDNLFAGGMLNFPCLRK